MSRTGLKRGIKVDLVEEDPSTQTKAIEEKNHHRWEGEVLPEMAKFNQGTDTVDQGILKKGK